MIDWLEANMATCMFVKYFHIECPGCGMQRAFIALLRGDLLHSIQLFPALIPYIVTVVLLIVQLIFKFRTGAFAVMWGFIVSVAIMIVTYIIRLMV